ncbi:Glycerol-3-phosphate acyltransferase 1, mitochondrial [Hondaea fermentalgiana]|uniref:Glycerol-3-phosphate acyltransferase 1, mitochondrial n=1 Tax=Hondaea fermentalgiana TaxID=2315210 RepID=A0A2R5GJC3_9STRA|nr:Glycerol-3-phosphate acyltransferase 1, mitochondrial [Hondaea fermentalgiana]|eukprot:GBG28391.1 Glycerol-3-phosphate acyltransferase 1, mitochondrial [Hondaea fermentalgiana]
MDGEGKADKATPRVKEIGNEEEVAVRVDAEEEEEEEAAGTTDADSASTPSTPIRVATPPTPPGMLAVSPPSPRGPRRDVFFQGAGPTKAERMMLRQGSALKTQVVDVMHEAWKTRASRENASPTLEESISWWRRIAALLTSDLWFALGRYKGGGLLGPPLSIQQMYNAKVEIEPTQSPSEGFESSCGRAGDEEELDSSLQLISKRMKEILSRIEGRCRMSAVRFLGWILGKLWKAIFSAIEVDLEGVSRAREGLERAARSGSAVMLLPTHRSHIDYLLMSYLHFGFNFAVPHIASGDNLNIPVIGPLFSYSGAFFLRRSFRGDNLYKKVLYGYLLRKLREGAPVEVFIEGGRSRTGMISEPKLGMILMAVRFVREGSIEDVTLLPSSIDYERTLETEGHVAQQLGSKKKKESLFGTIRSGLGILFGASNYGQAYVNFADGISVRKVINEVEAAHGGEQDVCYVPEEVYVKAVARHVILGQRRVSYLTPVAFVAAALLGSPAHEGNEEPTSKGSASSHMSSFADVDILAHPETGLLRRMAFLFRLARASGACLPPNLDLEDDDNAIAVIERAQEVLRPFLAPVSTHNEQVPKTVSSVKASAAARGHHDEEEEVKLLQGDEANEEEEEFKIDIKEDKCAPQGSSPSSSSSSSSSSSPSQAASKLEDEAARRLRLRYSCGQLLPKLAPACVVATALQVKTSNISRGAPVRVESVLRGASFVADLVRNNVPGADLDPAALRMALSDLAEASVLRIVAENEDGSPAQIAVSTDAASEDHLRMLRVLLAPAVSSCCAVLNAVISLMHKGTFSREEVIEIARQSILRQARGEVTDWARRHASPEDGVHSLGPVVAAVEALSNVELRAAVKTIQSMGIIAPPLANGSMGLGGFGSASQASLMSFSSSRSFSSLNSSDEKRSASSSANGADAPAPVEPTHLYSLQPFSRLCLRRERVAAK